jgi:hypothetical protein
MSTEHPVQLLERYVLDPDPFEGDAIPRRLPHAAVAAFVRARVTRATPFASLLRAEQLVTFYDLQEVCAHLLGLLPPAPAPADVPAAAVIARTVAAACPPEAVQRVAGYAAALAAAARGATDLAELVELQDRLPPGTDARPLTARVEQLRTAAAARAATDNQARLETARLDEIRSLRLERVRRAGEVKARVLAMADRPARIGEEIKMYLTLEYGYLEYLMPWAAARLRRETWGDDPATQVLRADSAARRAEVARMFQTFAAGLDQHPDVDPENRPSLRVRCLRAVEFFGGRLAGSEQAFIGAHAGRQVDLLSNE